MLRIENPIMIANIFLGAQTKSIVVVDPTGAVAAVVTNDKVIEKTGYRVEFVD